MTTENLDTDKITPDTGTDVVTPVPEPDKPITVAGKEYANQGEVVKALENANSKIGEMGNTIGTLSKQVTPPPKETENDDPEPEYDPYDKSKLSAWNSWDVRRQVQEQRASDTKVQNRETAEKQAQSITQFASDHPDMLHKTLQDVAKFADTNGIADMQTAYERMEKKGMFSPPGTKDKLNKIDEGDKVPDTMPDAGSGTPVETIDDATISKMTDKDPDFLGKLTPERRLQYLRSDNV